MHEPLRRRAAAAVEPGPVEPEAAARRILDDVIVALDLVVCLPPPFPGDALGPLGLRHLTKDAAPAELARRSFWNQRHDLGGFRTREQEQRAGAGGNVARPLRQRSVARASHDDGALGDVALMRVQPPYGLRSQALFQPVDELGEAGRIA